MSKLGPHLQHLEKNMTPGMTPCRVFLVEDDLDDRVLSKKRLEASEKVAEVLTFSNGDELIEYMEKAGFHDHTVMCLRPTIILIDLNMPRMNGFEVLRQIKSDAFLQEIPVVVVSQNATPENIQKAHELKADGFFKKPLNVQKIQAFFTRGWQWPTQEMWSR
jgi:two-component system response regulator